MLLGPFVDRHNEDVINSDICFRNQTDETLVFLTYDDIFQHLMKVISKELDSLPNTKVILVPSAREINHIHPLP